MGGCHEQRHTHSLTLCPVGYTCEMIRPGANLSVYLSGALRGAVARPRRADHPLAFLAHSRRARLGQTAMNPLAVNALADAIQTQEGYYPGSVSYSNNNPGNLVYAAQSGASPGPGGFAVFSSYAAGRQAEVNQISLDATRGTDVNGNPILTVGDLISSWAPASAGNDTASYISSVSQQTGYSPSDNLLGLGAGDGAVSGSDTPGGLIDLSGDAGFAMSSIPSGFWLLAAGLVAFAILR